VKPTISASLRAPVFAVGLFLAVAAGAGESLPTQSYRFLDWTVPHRVEEAYIQYVYDGDTVQDRYQRRIRLLGVDAPEVAHPEHDKFTNEPGGIEALHFTENKVRGKKAYLAIDDENAVDKYGRTLAVVFVKDDLGEWSCLNWDLVREGMAEVMILPGNRFCVEAEWHKLSAVASRRRAEDFRELAQSFKDEGRSESAVETYQRGIRLFPDARALYEDLAGLYLGMNLPGFSVDIYLAYLERHPGDVLIRYRLARAYELMAAVQSLPLVDYRKKSTEEWGRLLGTEYDAEARQTLLRLEGKP